MNLLEKLQKANALIVNIAIIATALLLIVIAADVRNLHQEVSKYPDADYLNYFIAKTECISIGGYGMSLSEKERPICSTERGDYTWTGTIWEPKIEE